MCAFTLIMNMLDLNETEITNPSLAKFTKLAYVLELRLNVFNLFQTPQFTSKK